MSAVKEKKEVKTKGGGPEKKAKSYDYPVYAEGNTQDRPPEAKKQEFNPPARSMSSGVKIDETRDLRVLRSAVERLFAILEDMAEYDETAKNDKAYRKKAVYRASQRWHVADLVTVNHELYIKKRPKNPKT